uniref:Uncharacterized protein n=1 Tax=Grammatophora oceanica TaxID=210454 RepID=A0A7S1Y932_9STRA|mmetsp:Transcript_34041/g.50528  ORF Transcript_34041/g.50528 Transcript_34041/m.50528 type:complete len:116 (+) Transcript_34041:68-415(+)
MDLERSLLVSSQDDGAAGTSGLTTRAHGPVSHPASLRLCHDGSIPRYYHKKTSSVQRCLPYSLLSSSRDGHIQSIDHAEFENGFPTIKMTLSSTSLIPYIATISRRLLRLQHCRR